MAKKVRLTYTQISELSEEMAMNDVEKIALNKDKLGLHRNKVRDWKTQYGQNNPDRFKTEVFSAWRNMNYKVEDQPRVSVLHELCSC